MRNSKGNVTQLLKLIELELRHELQRQCRATLLQIFDAPVVRAGVSEFYDNTIVDRIQIKAHRLLNPRLEILQCDVHWSNESELLFSLPPKTATHVNG